MLDSYLSIAIERYHMETVALLSESFAGWADQVRKGRYGSAPIATEPAACGDIEFHLVQVRFAALPDNAERDELERLPTSFALQPEQVDHLRDAARRILRDSKQSQHLLEKLQN